MGLQPSIGQIYTISMRTLRDDVEDFLQVHPEVTASRLGDQAVGDKYFVAGLRKGRQPREGTVQRVRRWIANYVQKATARDAGARGARERLARMVRDIDGSASPETPST